MSLRSFLICSVVLEGLQFPRHFQVRWMLPIDCLKVISGSSEGLAALSKRSNGGALQMNYQKVGEPLLSEHFWMF